MKMYRSLGLGQTLSIEEMMKDLPVGKGFSPYEGISQEDVDLLLIELEDKLQQMLSLAIKEKVLTLDQLYYWADKAREYADEYVKPTGYVLSDAKFDEIFNKVLVWMGITIKEEPVSLPDTLKKEGLKTTEEVLRQEIGVKKDMPATIDRPAFTWKKAATYGGLAVLGLLGLKFLFGRK